MELMTPHISVPPDGFLILSAVKGLGWFITFVVINFQKISVIIGYSHLILKALKRSFPHTLWSYRLGNWSWSTLIMCPGAHSCLAAECEGALRSPTPRLCSLSDSLLPSIVLPVLLFDDFFAVTGWLTQVSCKQTQPESALPCLKAPSVCERVYGRDTCAWHRPSNLFSV